MVEDNVWTSHFQFMSLNIPRSLDESLFSFYTLTYGIEFRSSVESMSSYIKRIKCKFDFSDIPIFFIENRFIAGYDNNTIYLHQFEPEETMAIDIPFEKNISSVCSLGTMIYCCLMSGEIKYFSCEAPNQVINFGCHFDKDDDQDDNLMLLASGKFIITISGDTVITWSRNEAKKLGEYHGFALQFGDHFQVDDNKLYWTVSALKCTILYSMDLTNGQLFTVGMFKRLISKININGNKGTCLVKHDPVHKNNGFMTFTLNPFKTCFVMKIDPVVSIPAMLSLEGITLFFKEGEQHDEIVFIDPKNGTALDSLFCAKIHECDQQQKIAHIYKESIFIAAADNLIEIISFVPEEED